MNAEDRDHLIKNIVGSMSGITSKKEMRLSTDSYVTFSVLT